ncbi:MAG: winged helix-turn-helix transcriptional regulator [Parabacteroides sp.]
MELERDHIITRTVHPVSPPRVEYALSDLGRSVLPCILQMEAWGEQIMSPKL